MASAAIANINACETIVAFKEAVKGLGLAGFSRTTHATLKEDKKKAAAMVVAKFAPVEEPEESEESEEPPKATKTTDAPNVSAAQLKALRNLCKCVMSMDVEKLVSGLEKLTTSG